MSRSTCCVVIGMADSVRILPPRCRSNTRSDLPTKRATGSASMRPYRLRSASSSISSVISQSVRPCSRRSACKWSIVSPASAITCSTLARLPGWCTVSTIRISGIFTRGIVPDRWYARRSAIAGENCAMISTSKAFMTAALAAIFLGLAGCASKKEPAEQALAALEQKFAESSAEIQTYLPERHAELQKSIEALRASMASEDYGDVVTGAAQASDALKRSIAESRVARAQLIAAMETEWGELVKTMPAMIAVMDKKIS